VVPGDPELGRRALTDAVVLAMATTVVGEYRDFSDFGRGAGRGARLRPARGLARRLATAWVGHLEGRLTATIPEPDVAAPTLERVAEGVAALG
jgi:hypothetical protein